MPVRAFLVVLALVGASAHADAQPADGEGLGVLEDRIVAAESQRPLQSASVPCPADACFLPGDSLQAYRTDRRDDWVEFPDWRRMIGRLRSVERVGYVPERPDRD